MSPMGFIPTVIQSESIAYGEGNITSATILLTDAQLSDVNGFTYYLTNDGGTTWEEVSRNVENTFDSTGSDLRFQILGNVGETIKVTLTNGSHTPIKVSYTI
jgi:hypothetical protein